MLLSSLARHGFAVVKPSPAATAALQQAVLAWRERGTFRHPPVPNDAQAAATTPTFTPARPCFNALFDVCRSSLRQLDQEWRDAHDGSPLGAPLDALPDGDVFLPSAELPFEGVQPPTVFDESFFNLFNYDHGSLNAHVDRGLITVVYGFTGEDDGQQPKSQLWLRDVATDRWREAEAVCGEDSALLFAGEKLEQMTGGTVKAVEHAVRVVPDGEFLAHSHFTRDPAARTTGNRLSAAMIFSFADGIDDDRPS